MRVTRAAGLEPAGVDAVVLPVLAGEGLAAGFSGVDKKLGGALARLVGGEFSARVGASTTVLSLGNLRARRVVLLGLGRRQDLDRVRVGNAFQMGLADLASAGVRSVAVGWPGEEGLDASAWAQAVVEAGIVSGFTQATHRSSGRAGAIEKITLGAWPQLPRRALEEAEALGDAALLARRLVNVPASELGPAELGEEATRQAREHGLEWEVLDEKRLAKLGYGGMLAVGQGSYRRPAMIVLRYRAAKRAAGPALALVGKGITFDTGGISIKPSGDMHYMKGDMGGAAAVLGAMTAIARLKPAADVVGILCAAENMPSGRAMRPGDVVTMGSGRTVEIIDTDAEGRMVLGDGLHHAVGLGAHAIVDIATLTGAQRIALGPVAGMLQGNSEALTARVLEAAALAGERYWEMPMFPEYESMLESPIADLANTAASRNASAIFAGFFLREFVGEAPWVHLDIAAPSWNREAKIKEMPKGPMGFGARTLARLALGLGERKSDKIGRK